MKNSMLKKYLSGNIAGYFIIAIASILLIYLLISLYFTKHFFFHTIINGVDVSLKSYEDADDLFSNYIMKYKLTLIERHGETEELTGTDMGLQYNNKNNINYIYNKQNSFLWIGSLFNKENYYLSDLYKYDTGMLNKKINELKCLNRVVVEPRNVRFKYLNGSYEMIEEVYGNKINKNQLNKVISSFLLRGKYQLNLDENLCYENPKYTLSSDKAIKTRDLLNKYIASKIIYHFGDKYEILDDNIINNWLKVDDDLEISINKTAVINYIKVLGRKYDTVGALRSFQTSTGKTIEIEGGLYGWKINQEAEIKELLKHIESGEVIEKEPAYSQKALYSREDDIGKTYVEISITRQYLWFYKNGKLIAQGSVVTGNPNRGNSTVVGIYMLTYKDKNAILSGPGYKVEVTYWMPFFGNMGIHDAKWRYSFGGEIYKRRGTHGCVNAPYQLAKTIFENIEVGIPIICYEE